ncbi:MAG: glutathione S-transferase family protein [Myxococcales bacterium]|nr:glutathione S-transferase family protein [Myxococcales bacterium]
MSQQPVVMWQLPRIWGLPNPSPFCAKLETWLRMAAVPYETRTITGPPKSKSGKMPYIERPDGSVMSDSTAIIETLSRERGIDLDAALSPEQRGMSVLLQRSLEEHLYFLMLHERWVDEGGWARCRADYFGTMPAPVRLLVVPFVRRQVTRDARGQGLSRLSDAERLGRARADLDAISAVLGERDFFFDQPSNIDATAFAFLINATQTPLDLPLHREAAKRENLVRYVARMGERYYPEGFGDGR